jgi:tetratricopeptide (TPR) repeat protein
MLNEEGLILVALVVACALVVLGAIELVWPSRPRHPERRKHPVHDPWRAARARTALPTQPTPITTVGAGAASRDAVGAASPPSAPVATSAAIEPAPPPPVAATPRAPEPPPAPVPDPVAVAPIEPVAVEPTPPVAATPPTLDTPAPGSPPTLRIVPPVGGRADVRRERSRGPRPRAVPRSVSNPPRPEPEPPSAEAARPTGATPSGDAGSEPERPGPEASVVERCVALLDARRLADVVTLGEEALEARKSAGEPVTSPAASRETAQLWGVVGLAKQGLDDFEGARFAFEEAIAVAPRTERPTWERRLATLALTVGRQSLGRDDADPPRPARVDSLRSAIDWLERGLAVTPDDTGLKDALASAREALWPTYEAVVKALVQRQDFGEARRILDQVLGDPDCPSERQGTLRRLLATTLSGEAGQATAEALVHLQRGQDAAAAETLARAEAVIAAMGPDALPAQRRQELERRLWSAYVKLGIKRVEAGAQEAAMGPLFRALALTTIGSERPEVARAMLGRALGEIVNARSAEIGRLIDAGDLGAASAESDKLWSLLRATVDQGLPEDDALEAFDKVLGLYRRLGGKRA